jgi:hypothetical protein
MNTDFWKKAINKEMAKVKITWATHDGHTPQQIREGKVAEFIGFQEIRYHTVFDIKIDFTRKARFVAGGHTTSAPSLLTYSSVVSRDSVHLAFLIAALNNIDIMSCDLENANLNAPCRKKIWFEGGIECGKDRRKVCVVCTFTIWAQKCWSSISVITSTDPTRFRVQIIKGRSGCMDAQGSKKRWSQIL